MFISVRFDDYEVFKIKATLGATPALDSPELPEVVEAFFSDLSDPDDVLDTKAYILITSVDTALRNYFSESVTDDEYESTDHSAARPE